MTFYLYLFPCTVKRGSLHRLGNAKNDSVKPDKDSDCWQVQ